MNLTHGKGAYNKNWKNGHIVMEFWRRQGEAEQQHNTHIDRSHILFCLCIVFIVIIFRDKCTTPHVDVTSTLQRPEPQLFPPMSSDIVAYMVVGRNIKPAANRPLATIAVGNQPRRHTTCRVTCSTTQGATGTYPCCRQGPCAASLSTLSAADSLPS